MSQVERVMGTVITPLQDIYGKYADGMVSAMIEDLQSYSDEVLTKAVMKVRREVKTRPTIAHIIEACGEFLPQQGQPKESKDESFFCRGQAEKERPSVAREILSSREGRLALELGVGRDLLTEYEKTGRKKFDEGFVRKSYDAWKLASSEISRANKETHAAYGGLLGLYEAMCARERVLYETYYHQESVAI